MSPSQPKQTGPAHHSQNRQGQPIPSTTSGWEKRCQPAGALTATLLPAALPTAVPAARPVAKRQSTLPILACCVKPTHEGATMPKREVPSTPACSSQSHRGMLKGKKEKKSLCSEAFHGRPWTDRRRARPPQRGGSEGVVDTVDRGKKLSTRCGMSKARATAL